MTEPTGHRAVACGATVRTEYASPTRADRVARAVVPDNTASMTTQVEGPTVTTEIDRETTGGLQSTVDDYIVNLGVAEAVLDAIETAAADNDGDADDTDADIGSAANTAANTADSTAAEPTTDNTTQS